MNLRSALCIVAAFVLKTIFPSFIKINDGAFVERAIVIPEDAFEERLPDAFNVRIDAEVHTVHGDFCVSAPRRRQTDGIKQRIAHKLTNLSGILLVIVQREVRLPVKFSIFVDIVQFDFEGGARLAERAEEPFFPNADARKYHTVNRNARLDISIRPLGRL